MTYAQEVCLLLAEGGLTGHPSVLRLVSQFLDYSDHQTRIVNCLGKAPPKETYDSLVDYLLVELIPEFGGYHLGELCRQFYEGNGKPLREICPTQTIDAIDRQLKGKLDQLVHGNWSSWEHFKREGANWEPL